MYLCENHRILFSTDSLPLYNEITGLYEVIEEESKDKGVIKCILSNSALSDNGQYTNRKPIESSFRCLGAEKEYNLKVLVITSTKNDFSELFFDDYDILIAACLLPEVKDMLKSYNRPRLFFCDTFDACLNFTRILFMTYASHNIIDLDFYDVTMAFATTESQTIVIQHYSYDEAKEAKLRAENAIVYVYTSQKDLFQLTSIYNKFQSLCKNDMLFMACSGNKAVGEKEGMFIALKAE